MCCGHLINYSLKLMTLRLSTRQSKSVFRSGTKKRNMAHTWRIAGDRRLLRFAIATWNEVMADEGTVHWALQAKC